MMDDVIDRQRDEQHITHFKRRVKGKKWRECHFNIINKLFNFRSNTVCDWIQKYLLTSNRLIFAMTVTSSNDLLVAFLYLNWIIRNSCYIFRPIWNNLNVHDAHFQITCYAGYLVYTTRLRLFLHRPKKNTMYNSYSLSNVFLHIPLNILTSFHDMKVKSVLTWC